MVDLRAPHRVLADLADARRQFEKGGPAPLAVRDRLVELAEALAESGPLELGVSPRRWVESQSRVTEIVARLQPNPTDLLSTTRAKQAMGRLRRLMRSARWSSRWRARTRGSPRAPVILFALSALIVTGLTWMIESLAQGQSSARWLLPALPIVAIFFFVCMSSIWRAREAAQVRELAATIAPTERPLAYCRTRGRQFVVATDRRLLAINLPSSLHSSREQWSMPYDQITAIQPRNKKLGAPMTVRTSRDLQQIPVRELLATSQDSYDYQRHHHKALLLIVRRRTRSEPAMAPDRAS